MNQCCICCPVLNVGVHLNRVINNMEKMGKLFSDYKIVFFYDQSDDNTLDIILHRMEHNKKLYVLVNGFHKRVKERTHNLAHARNKMLDFIREKCPDYEYFMMVDGDEVSSSTMNIDLLKRTINRKDWDGITFNRAGEYYDLWALSSKRLVLSLWHFEQPNTSTIFRDEIYHEIRECKEGDLIHAYSAFNGVGLYRTKKFIDSKYDGKPRLDLIPPFLIDRTKEILKVGIRYFWRKDDERDQDCEHKAFHHYAVFNNNAKMRISPESLF